LEDPVLIIKTASESKDLAVDFRPPSAGMPSYDIGESMGEAMFELLDK
jgi:hypothetical protein